MNVLRTNITLPKTVFKQLQIAVPQGQRSKFISDAIVEKLGKAKTQDEALELSLKANVVFYKKEAKNWEIIETERWPE